MEFLLSLYAEKEPFDPNPPKSFNTKNIQFELETCLSNLEELRVSEIKKYSVRRKKDLQSIFKELCFISDIVLFIISSPVDSAEFEEKYDKIWSFVKKTNAKLKLIKFVSTYVSAKDAKRKLLVFLLFSLIEGTFLDFIHDFLGNKKLKCSFKKINLQPNQQHAR